MPLMQIKTNVMLPEKQREARLAPLSRLLAELTRKPEAYCMVAYEHAAMLFAGNPGPAAFVDIRAIGGLTREVNAQLSAALATEIKKALGVPPDRLYFTFTEVAASHWGWNGELFG
jgi:phenylpyruvate tautomerase PptA (4-oxalocrotonate tautomerase family)